MNNYLTLMRRVLNEGYRRSDRTGTGTLALFGEHLRFDMNNGFPLVTTRKIYWNNITAELAGFLEGSTSVKRFQELGTNIWNANVADWGGEDYMGKIYGYQWRNWGDQIDQLRQVVNEIARNPHSRRHLVTAWNPSELDQMCLPPCHTHFQFFVADGELSLIFYMRSVDIFLGLPHDIATYALLLHIVAKQLRLIPRTLKCCLADTHIYLNHIDQCVEQLSRHTLPLPTLWLADGVTIDNFKPEDAKLIGYNHDKPIKAPMSV